MSTQRYSRWCKKRTHSTSPSEADRSAVIQSIAYLAASDRYQDDVNNEDYSREEGRRQDDREADDRGEARSSITLGTIDLEVTPSSEKGEKGNDQRDKGEAAGDRVQDKGNGQRL